MCALEQSTVYLEDFEAVIFKNFEVFCLTSNILSLIICTDTASYSLLLAIQQLAFLHVRMCPIVSVDCLYSQ